MGYRGEVMAPNGTVNTKSNCANLSNPYHQCTQACFQKTNGTKPHSHSHSHSHTHPNNKKSSGYGRSATDGELAKKMSDERRTHSGCPKASNPYHKCDENCHRKSSDSGSSSFLVFFDLLCYLI